MQNLIMSADTLAKLAIKHNVTQTEVEHCFSNRTGKLLQDSRAEHLTNPPSLWFLALTNQGRLLKIVYIHDGSKVILKTAFPPNAAEIAIYDRHG